MKLKIGKKEIAGFFKGIPGFIGRNMRYAVLGIFLAGFVACIFIWHAYVYDPGWSEQRKADYMNSKNEEMSFSEKKFDRAVDERNARKKEYAKKLSGLKDIFGLGK